ncbi:MULTISPECIES: class I SAM-dependent methyltransferase [unclassified Yoonia]|uniref:class I SAM-dependent methyltransferase n=1 Tax=unclassified Yoonia TaxID=2629118 RepID=UPI002AFEAFF8|nr:MULTISPECIES: class I SAM-dependent methyltransferase [unclassified Yoonia]
MADASHAELMDQTYRYQRRIYDATRAFYLLGRDHLIAHLDPPKGGKVLEIACGTGRNLDHIARRYPDSVLYGLDISEEMLRSARAKLGDRAVLAQGDACHFDPNLLFGVAQFDRIIFSYSLSMIPDWTGALAQALQHLAPGGSLHLVDFGRQHRLPGLAKRGLNAWLARFHVSPRHDLPQIVADLTARHGLTLQVTDLHGSYAQHAVLGPRKA